MSKRDSNFQSSAMLEGSESVEVEGGSTGSAVASSISACKKVLCSNSVLDSSEYWQRNEKALCRLGLLEDDAEGGCTMPSDVYVVSLSETGRCKLVSSRLSLKKR
ncbi:hypothetical protein F2P81_017321 [Scophthalmus maximus]|uniref:Uncharacterized protein n=1 Tax=Scophthalmus maximus TaxID=52904 RepID=A0A6A4SFF8_SCOMX|nr:hypothetical protein F2P81_017321 [Scophthalmus maximus]